MVGAVREGMERWAGGARDRASLATRAGAGTASGAVGGRGRCVRVGGAAAAAFGLVWFGRW